MAQVQVEIDIPDGYEISGEPRWVTLDSFKRPEGGVAGFVVDIVPTWKWPSWIKTAAIAMQKTGTWTAHERAPAIDDFYQVWTSSGRWFTIHEDLMDFTPPPCTDWRKSLRLNPNRTT